MSQPIELAMHTEVGVPFEDQIHSVIGLHGAIAEKELRVILGRDPIINVRDYQVSKTQERGDAVSRLPAMIASQVTVHAGMNTGVELEFSWHKSDPEKVYARVRPSSKSAKIADWIVYIGGILGVGLGVCGLGFTNTEVERAHMIALGILFLVGLLAGVIASRLFLFFCGSWTKKRENQALQAQVEGWVRERFPPATSMSS